MKRDTHGHPKVDTLARKLKIPLPHAIGLLDLLWTATGRFSPKGDIGKLSDEEIAGLLHWCQDDDQPHILISALCESRWIDRVDGPERLLVHDWPDHCEDYVHTKLARHKEYFADGSVPNFSKLSKEEKLEAQSFFVRTKAHKRVKRQKKEDHKVPALALANALAIANNSPPTPSGGEGENLELPIETKSLEEIVETETVATATRMHAIHPRHRRGSLPRVIKKLGQAVATVKLTQRLQKLREIEANHKAWVDYWIESQTEYIHDLGNWLSPKELHYESAPEPYIRSPVGEHRAGHMNPGLVVR